MMRNNATTYIKKSRNLLLFLVVMGYIVTFIANANALAQTTAIQIVLGILFGVIYLVLGFSTSNFLNGFHLMSQTLFISL